MENGVGRQILDAYKRCEFRALVQLYLDVADDHEARANHDAACYYWTVAYVFALQEGMDCAEELRQKLAAHGREY